MADNIVQGSSRADTDPFEDSNFAMAPLPDLAALVRPEQLAVSAGTKHDAEFGGRLSC